MAKFCTWGEHEPDKQTKEENESARKKSERRNVLWSFSSLPLFFVQWRLCVFVRLQFSNAYLYISVFVLPHLPLLSLISLRSFFSSPLSSSCIFPQFGVTSVLNTPHLLHLKLFFTAETLSLRRIKRTNLLTNSKHRATLLMSAALLSSCFVFPSFIFLPCPPLPTLFFCLRAVT